jgi:hypothetical protein
MQTSRIFALLLGAMMASCCLSQTAPPAAISAPSAASGSTSQPGPADNTAVAANLVKLYKANENTPGGLEIFQHPVTYLTQIRKAAAQAAQPEATAANNASVANAVQNRTDQQTTAPAGSPSSSSTTSKGSVPSLLSFAVESGALTESANGTTTTVQANLANVLKAINGTKFMTFYRSQPSNLLAHTLSTASVSASFNTGSSSSSTSTSTSPSTFNSLTAHMDLRNHRDPRDLKWFNEWNNLSNNQLQAVATNVPEYEQALQQKIPTQYAQWTAEAQTELTRLGATKSPSDDQITTAMMTILNDFETLLYTPSGQDYAADYSKALQVYAAADSVVLNKIGTSFVFSFEYTFVNQASASLPKSTTQTYSIGTTPPDLSTFNLIFAGGNLFGTNATLTANASTTLFTAPSAQLHLTPVRDYKISGELDVPLPPIGGSKKSTIEISGLFQDLIQEPLGQTVTVNGVAVSTRGNIWLGQGKWNLPIGSTGVTVPFSVTGSNRTDLIKETHVIGSFGISYNLDSLFAKP